LAAVTLWPANLPTEATKIRVEYVTSATDPAAKGSSVIFADDFDSPGDLHKRYFEYIARNGSFVPDSMVGYGGSGGSMHCRFNKDQIEAGSLKVLFGRNPFHKGIKQQESYREIYWRVYVKHEAGWLGNPAKLARLTCLAGTDWSQGFIAHVWGGKNDALCIDPATGILNSHKVSEAYNDFAHLKWLGVKNTTTPIFSTAESGRWVCVESRAKLNTPGKEDGVFQLWIDGRLEASRTDLNWHGKWETFGINALFLENYWNKGAVKAESRWFDNLVVSTQPIGPVSTTGNPTIHRTGNGNARWQAEITTNPDRPGDSWQSNPIPGAMTDVTVGESAGLFSAANESTKALKEGTYWIRLRQETAPDTWTEWTAWHSPFRAVGS